MMPFPITVRRVITVIALTAAWCALWNAISFANVASGIVVSSLVLLSGVGTSGRGGVRLVPLLHFTWLVMVDLVKASISVGWEILTPTDYTEEAIIAVDAPMETRGHLLLLVVAITVTPGTAVIDTDPDSGRLYVHVLHASKSDEIRAHILELAQLACDALPVPDDMVALAGESLDQATGDQGGAS